MPIDLSSLEPPDVVETVSFEAILAEMLADLQARDAAFTALVESDPAYKVLEVAAYREMLLRQRVNDAAHQCMLAYATGSNLDNLAALFDVKRLTLTEATDNTAATYESDDDLRTRVLLALSSASTAGPTNAYKYWALQVEEVKDVLVSSPNPCEVQVVIMGRTGDGSVDATVIAAVKAALSADNVRPLTDKVTVVSAEAVGYTVAATIYIYDGPDAATVYNNAVASLTEYVNSRKIGRDVPLSGIYAALSVSGVSRVVLASPTADVSVSDTQVGYCSIIAVTNGGIGE
jgi:phage-related baseplate assembly protein